MKLINLILALGLFFLVAYGIETSHAGGSTPSNSADAHSDSSAEIGDIIGGDTILGGDKALGLGFSYALGDVDLNEGKNCFVSTAHGNILFGKQEVGLNPWCAALFYDANRRHERAAAMRCTIESIADTHPYYGDQTKCIKGETLAPVEIVSSPELNAVVAQYQEDEDEREELYEEIQQQLEEQQAQYEELSARRSRPAPVQQSAAEAYWTEDRRAKLEAIKGEQ